MWKYLPPKKPGDKWRKVPLQPNGATASSTDRSTWRPFDMCKGAYERGGYDGIGFVFDGAVGEDDLCFVGIDFDHCITDNVLQEPAKGWISPIITYAEQSVSGTGVHCIARAKPIQAVTYKNADGKGSVEIYSTSRYFTFTGHILPPRDQIKTVPEASTRSPRNSDCRSQRQKPNPKRKNWFRFPHSRSRRTCSLPRIRKRLAKCGQSWSLLTSRSWVSALPRCFQHGRPRPRPTAVDDDGPRDGVHGGRS